MALGKAMLCSFLKGISPLSPSADFGGSEGFFRSQPYKLLILLNILLYEKSKTI
jgi:hypothetical protein